MKAVPGYPLKEGQCLKLKSTIYGLVQSPRAYYKLCKEVYSKCGLRQLKSDECVFVRYANNIKGAPDLTTTSSSVGLSKRWRLFHLSNESTLHVLILWLS